MAKAVYWHATDSQGRKRGEQTGLDTLVVHAVNGAHSLRGELWSAPWLSQRVKCAAWGLRPQG